MPVGYGHRQPTLEVRGLDAERQEAMGIRSRSPETLQQPLWVSEPSGHFRLRVSRGLYLRVISKGDVRFGKALPIISFGLLLVGTLWI